MVYQGVFATMHPVMCLDVVVLHDRVLCVLEYLDLVIICVRRSLCHLRAMTNMMPGRLRKT